MGMVLVGLPYNAQDVVCSVSVLKQAAIEGITTHRMYFTVFDPAVSSCTSIQPGTAVRCRCYYFALLAIVQLICGHNLQRPILTCRNAVTTTDRKLLSFSALICVLFC